MIAVFLVRAFTVIVWWFFKTGYKIKKSRGVCRPRRTPLLMRRPGGSHRPAFDGARHWPGRFHCAYSERAAVRFLRWTAVWLFFAIAGLGACCDARGHGRVAFGPFGQRFFRSSGLLVCPVYWLAAWCCCGAIIVHPCGCLTFCLHARIRHADGYSIFTHSGRWVELSSICRFRRRIFLPGRHWRFAALGRGRVVAAVGVHAQLYCAILFGPVGVALAATWLRRSPADAGARHCASRFCGGVVRLLAYRQLTAVAVVALTLSPTCRAAHSCRRFCWRPLVYPAALLWAYLLPFWRYASVPDVRPHRPAAGCRMFLPCRAYRGADVSGDRAARHDYGGPAGRAPVAVRCR